MTAFLLAGLLGLSLCACGSDAPPVTSAPAPTVSAEPLREKEFRLAYDPNDSLHPITGGSQVNQSLTSLVYEGLYALDERFAPQPVLARDASVDDTGLVWTVTVADGVVFSDGTPLTADHVADSLRAAKTSALYASRLREVTAVRAEGNGVVITLSAPNHALPALLDIPIVLERSGEPAPLGTGRYRYALDGESLYLTANYNREGDLPYDTIRLSPVTGADQRIDAFDSGEVSAVVTDFFSPYALGYSGSYEVWDYPTTDLLYMGFRTTAGPCAVPLVRQALSRAFDRETLVRNQLAGHGDAAALPISPVHEDWDAAAAGLLEYDRQAAADLLTQAGYAKQEDGLLYRGRTALTLTMLVNSDNAAKCAVADWLAEELGALGITVTVSKLPWKEYLTALQNGRFDLYLGEVRLTGDFDVAPLLTGSLNYGGHWSDAMTQALWAWKSGAEGAAETLWTVFAQETPIAPLCFKWESLLVRWDTVTGLNPTRGDPFRGMENWVPATE